MHLNCIKSCKSTLLRTKVSVTSRNKRKYKRGVFLQDKMFFLGFFLVKVHRISSRENQNQTYRKVQSSEYSFTAGRGREKDKFRAY